MKPLKVRKEIDAQFAGFAFSKLSGVEGALADQRRGFATTEGN